jgi:choline-sulfatase
MSKTARHPRILCSLVMAMLAGCGEVPSNWPVAHDLAKGIVVAEEWSETRRIDLASHRGRRHLVSGWSADRWDRQRQRGFVVGVEESSVLRFDLIEVRPMVVRVFAGPVDQEAVDAVSVEVLVNGNAVTSIKLRGRPRRYRLAIPDGVLRSGENDLVLRNPAYEEGVGPQVKWYLFEMRFSDGSEPPRSFLTEEEALLMIPYGNRLEYTVMLPAEGVLTIERLQYVGEAGGGVRLIVEEDGKDPTELALPAETAEAIVLPLPAGSPRIARVSLEADHPAARISSRSGALLTAPAIRSSAVKPEELPGGRKTPNSVLPRLEERPNILLYVVDTLRADHLGMYGYDEPVSPALDNFVTQATVFGNAVAQSSWTRASMASIFTGLWPLKHATNGRKDILDAGATTLAEVLREAGYVTVAKVRNWNVFPVFGFRQGFQEFRKVREGKADRLNRLVENWLTSRPEDRPFFMWVHTVDPHEPYRPPDETRHRFMEEGQEKFDLDKHPSFKLTREMSKEEQQSIVEYLISLYDAEIAFNDRAFGDLVALLEKHGLLDSTVVVFVSDHGEEFLDHGTWGHGRNLYAENLNVPLVIRFPDRGHGIRVDEVVQQIDLMPTLLDYLGLPVPEVVEGRSLLPLVDNNMISAGPPAPMAFSFLHLDGARYRSLVDGDWKLIQRLSADGEASQSWLFDRRVDPGEALNKSLEMPIRSRFMELHLDAKMAEDSVLTTEEAVLDEETENALKALGYLQ